MEPNEEKSLFSFLESSMSNVEGLPKLPDEQLEYLVESAMDPIIGAKIVQLYAESQSPEAHEYIIRKYGNLLNYVFMGEYADCLVTARIIDGYGYPDATRASDMIEMLAELGGNGEVHVGGRLGYFERHYYTSETSDIVRPILSLRLYSGAFIRQDGDSGKQVDIPNYVTIPVTAVEDYEIKSRVEE